MVFEVIGLLIWYKKKHEHKFSYSPYSNLAQSQTAVGLFPASCQRENKYSLGKWIDCALQNSSLCFVHKQNICSAVGYTK